MRTTTFGRWAPTLIVLSLPLVLVLGGASLFAADAGRIGGDLAALAREGRGALWRSILAGGLSCLLVAALGLASAWLLGRASLITFRGHGLLLAFLLPLAILPLLIGGGAFAFLYRDLGGWWLAIAGAEARGAAAVIASITLAQTLRYAPLLLWLLALSAADVTPSRRRYARQVGASGAQWIRVELVGLWLPVVLVILAFTYQDAANDLLISMLALRPSPATGSELVAHALMREYLLLLTARPATQAMATLLVGAAVATLAQALGFLCVAALTVLAMRRLARVSEGGARPEGSSDHRAGPWFGALLPLAVLLTFLHLILRLRPGGTLEGVWSLGPTLLAAFLAASLGWSMAVLALYRLRDRPREAVSRTGRDLASAGMFAVGVGFIPPLGLAVAVFALAFALDAELAATGPAWLVIAETIRFAPVIFVLLVPTALAISDNEIDYLRASGVPFLARGAIAFLRPALHVHAAVLLIAVNLILNEAVISALFQADIPALADIVRRATTGRSADYGLAGIVIGAELLLFCMLLLVWGYSALKRWQEQRDAC